MKKDGSNRINPMMKKFSKVVKYTIAKKQKVKDEEEELKQDLRVFVSMTESNPRENHCDAFYDNPEKLFVHNPDRKIVTFDENNMFKISFYSTTGCSISVKLVFAIDPAASRKEKLE
jgi:hypothetical protein